MNENSHFNRYIFTAVLVLLIPLFTVLRLIIIETDPQQRAAFNKDEQEHIGWYETVTPNRGLIYDRWGHLLASNEQVYEVGVELKDVKNPQAIALTANLALGVDYAHALAAASLKYVPKDSVYSVLADNVTQDKIDRLKVYMQQVKDQDGENSSNNAANLRGLVYHTHLQRAYPEKTLGSNILGFVSREGKGYFGVEEKYNDLLSGIPVKVWHSLDPNAVQTSPSIPDGASLVLTIDRAVQAEIEEILDRSIKKTGSTSGTIVVTNPRNGEILAMATTPRMDVNKFWQYPEIFSKSVPYNRAVGATYEPGSVYKVLTMASALDAGSVKPETTFLDRGVFEIGGTYIHNWDGGAWGPQTMLGCMQHSLNVCLAWIASQEGPKTFYSYMDAFGIGHLTGVDMAGEAAGRLKMPGDEDWYDADLGTNAFGQGVSATPIQMASAIGAVANDGKIMAPHIVRSIINKGYQHDMELRVVGQPIKAETARTLTEMLAKSLEIESSDALVEGYRVAGKTGTAEIPTPFGYTSNATNASFVGWGPADDPQFLVYIWLEKPSASIWGSVVAAPVFAEVVKSLVVLLNIPPDDVRHQLYGQAPSNASSPGDQSQVH